MSCVTNANIFICWVKKHSSSFSCSKTIVEKEIWRDLAWCQCIKTDQLTDFTICFCKLLNFFIYNSWFFILCIAWKTLLFCNDLGCFVQRFRMYQRVDWHLIAEILIQIFQGFNTLKSVDNFSECMKLGSMKIIFEIGINRFGSVFRFSPCIVNVTDKLSIEFKHNAVKMF